MFREGATVWPFRSRRTTPRPLVAFNNSHSNDNRPGHSPGQRPCPKQVLTCHWIEIDGRLECRWERAAGGEGSQCHPRHSHPTGRAREPPSALAGSRRQACAREVQDEDPLRTNALLLRLSLVSVLKLVESLESFVIQERRPDSRKDPDVDA